MAHAKKPFAPGQLTILQNNLADAQKERDRLVDEKNELADKQQKYQAAQKKLQEKLPQEKEDNKKDKNTKETEVVAKETVEDFLHDWSELNGDKTISEPQK